MVFPCRDLSRKLPRNIRIKEKLKEVKVKSQCNVENYQSKRFQEYPQDFCCLNLKNFVKTKKLSNNFNKSRNISPNFDIFAVQCYAQVVSASKQKTSNYKISVRQTPFQPEPIYQDCWRLQ